MQSNRSRTRPTNPSKPRARGQASKQPSLHYKRTKTKRTKPRRSPIPASQLLGCPSDSVPVIRRRATTAAADRLLRALQGDVPMSFSAPATQFRACVCHDGYDAPTLAAVSGGDDAPPVRGCGEEPDVARMAATARMLDQRWTHSAHAAARSGGRPAARCRAGGRRHLPHQSAGRPPTSTPCHEARPSRSRARRKFDAVCGGRRRGRPCQGGCRRPAAARRLA